MTNLTPDQRSRRMFRLDLLRALPAGVLETVGTTFAVLILERSFSAGSTEKALVVSSPNIGLVLSIIGVNLLRRWPPNRTAAGFSFFAGSVLLLTAALSQYFSVFVLGVMLAMIAFGGQAPLVTALYRHNYAAGRRGQLFSLAGIARGICSVTFGWAGGALMEADPQMFSALLIAFGAAAMLTGACLAFMPSPPGVKTDTDDSAATRNPLSALRWVKEDKLFRTLLIAWMWTGLVVLSLTSLTVEYLANPRYGWNFPSGKIAVLTIVVPISFRLATTYFWGYAFDRANFFVLRLVLNFTFAVSLLTVYAVQSEFLLWIGMALRGIAMGGGNIAWNLWVTKLAPEERVGEYMSVHTFTTGIRGVIGPPLAFWLLTVTSAQTIVWVGFCIVLAASAMIVPYIKTAADLNDRA